MYYAGEQNVPGAAGNLSGSIAGGIPLKNMFPGASWDMPMQPVPTTRPGEKIPLKQLIPWTPGTFPGDTTPFGAKIPPGNLAGNPFGPQFVIPQRGIRGMTPAEIEELKQWDPQSAPAIENIYRNVKPGGPQLPLAYLNGSVPMGNAGAMEDIAQGYTQISTPLAWQNAGFQNKMVS